MSSKTTALKALFGSLAMMTSSLALAGSASAAEPPATTGWGVRGQSPSALSVAWTVRDIEHIGSRTYVAGRFTRVVDPNGVATERSSLAAFDSATGAWISDYLPLFNGPVHTITPSIDGSRLYVGGEFTQVNGVVTGPLAAIDAKTGALVPGFDAPVTATGAGRRIVLSVEVSGNDLYVGGDFASVSGSSRPYIARIDAATGALDPTFSPLIQQGAVMTIEPSANGQRVYVGGQFNRVENNTDLAYFVGLDSSGRVVPQRKFDIRPNPEAPIVLDIEEFNGKVYIASQSNMLSVVDATSLELVRLYGPDLANQNQPAWFKGSDFQALDASATFMYGGNHSVYSGVPANGNGNGHHDSLTGANTPVNVLSRYATDSSHDSSFVPLELKGGVWAIDAHPNGCVWIGGNLGVGATADWNLARICTAAAPLTVGSATTVTDLLHARDYTAADADTLRLYRAFFDRDPEVGGAQYWIGQSRAKVNYDDMAWVFANSPEFAATYGPVTNEQFLTIVYRNVLGRTPDQAGFDYWVGQMQGGLARHLVVRWVAASAEFTNRYPFAPLP